MIKYKCRFIGVALLLQFVLLQSGCNSGGESPSAAPGAISATSVSLNSASYTGGSAEIMNLTSYNSLLYLLNSNGEIWQTVYGGTIPTWTQVATLAEGESPTTIALNMLGALFTCTNLGDCYQYNGADNWFAQGAGTSGSPATDMIVISGNPIYMGNQAGQVWYYSGSAWSNISSGSGISAPINQLAIDSLTSPLYLGVASGSSVYAYTISSHSWTNLIVDAGTQYTDTGSTINSISYYSDGRNDYGYFGNSAGNVWRGIYDTATGMEIAFENMSSSTTFPGYDGTGAVTVVQADSNNNLYVGTATGQVLIWTPTTIAWSNITPASSNASAISTIGVYNSNTIFVGNQNGQMWALTWQ